MLIADAQVHIRAANTPERPWPARAEPHRAPLDEEELLVEMGKAGVDLVILVWGTDWSRLPWSYRPGGTMFTEEKHWLKGTDLDAVMSRGVCEWLGWRI